MIEPKSIFKRVFIAKVGHNIFQNQVLRKIEDGEEPKRIFQKHLKNEIIDKFSHHDKTSIAVLITT